MNEMDTLANQHFLEWELRLKHIDEMMVKAGESRTKKQERSDFSAALATIQQSRDAVALEIDDTRKLSATAGPAVVNQTAVIHTTLAAIGLQMEKLLSSVVGAD